MRAPFPRVARAASLCVLVLGMSRPARAQKITEYTIPTVNGSPHEIISGPDGSLARVAHLPSRHRVYTHINNTNPMLLEDGAERALVESAGVHVGTDGMRFTL